MKKIVPFRRLALLFMFLAPAFILSGISDLQAFSFYKDETYYEAALGAYKKKEYGQSIYLLGRALRENPKYFEAKQLLGWNYLFSVRLIESEAIFRGLQKEKKTDVRPVQGLAWTYYGQGRYDDARAAFHDELRKGEEHTLRDTWDYYPRDLQEYFTSIVLDANYGLGSVAKQQQAYNDAIRYLQTALRGINQFTARTDILLSLGDVYYGQGKEKEALGIYKEASREEQHNPKAHLRLAWTYYRMKSYLDAEREFKEAIDRQGDAVECLLGIAMCQTMQSRESDAYGTLVKAIRLNPAYMDNPTVHELIAGRPSWVSLWKEFGIAYKGRYAYNYRMGNYHAALGKFATYLAKANAMDPDTIVKGTVSLASMNGIDTDTIIAMGWCYRWLGHTDKAIELFQEVARQDGKLAEPHVGMGSAYMGQGKIDEALISFQRALTKDPDSPTACNGLAYLHQYRKEPDNAFKYLRKSLAVKKDYFDSQAFLANLLFEQQRYDEAAGEYEKLVNIDKSVITSWNGLGWAYYYGGKYREAAKAFQTTISLNPFLVDAHYGLSLSYAKMNDINQAKEEMVAAIDIDPYYCHTRDLFNLIKEKKKMQDLFKILGWSYFYKQRYDMALMSFQSYLELRKGDQDATKGIAWSNYWLGNLEAADAIFRGMLRINSNDIDALVGTGWVLYARGKDDVALEYLRKAVAIDVRRIDAWRGIAAIYVRNKNIYEANVIYEKIADM